MSRWRSEEEEEVSSASCLSEPEDMGNKSWDWDMMRADLEEKVHFILHLWSVLLLFFLPSPYFPPSLLPLSTFLLHVLFWMNL